STINTNYMQQPMQDPKDISDPTTAIDMALVLMAKAFKLNNTTPTKNSQRSSLNPHSRESEWSRNGKGVAARAEGNENENNENQIRCFNCQRVDHYAGNCIVKPRKRDAAYL
ncbi:retrovirus-related pol polyprotein from transposon TNT 1-94, partial [Tanacetum coccineum]